MNKIGPTPVEPIPLLYDGGTVTKKEAGTQGEKEEKSKKSGAGIRKSEDGKRRAQRLASLTYLSHGLQHTYLSLDP